MIIRSILFAASLLTLTACQTTGETGPVNLRTGMPVSELIDGYGKPSAVESTSGTRSYVWQLNSARLVDNSRRTAAGRGGVASSGNYNPQVVRIFCTLSVVADSNDRVTSWQADGEGCRQILLNQL